MDARSQTPVGKSTVNVEEANKLAMQQRGEAIAESLIREVKDQANALKRFLVNIIELDLAGTKAFRVHVSHHLSEQRKYVKAHKDTPEYDALKRTFGSAQVRLSEAVTFSKACDAGYHPDLKHETYHSAIAQSRVYLQTAGAAGPTARRGRKAKSFLDKLKDFVGKNAQNDEDLKHGQEFMQALLELHQARGMKSKPIADVVAKKAEQDTAAAAASETPASEPKAATIH